LVPAKNGFNVLSSKVDDVMHLQKMVRLPAPAQSPSLLPLSSTGMLAEKPVAKGSKREQPAGLRMRFKPPGSTEDPGGVELLDHDVQPHAQRSAQKQPLLDTSVASKKRKVHWTGSPSDERKKKKHTDSKVFEKVVVQREIQSDGPSEQNTMITAKKSNGLELGTAPATVTPRKSEGGGDKSRIKHKEKDRKRKKEKK